MTRLSLFDDAKVLRFSYPCKDFRRISVKNRLILDLYQFLFVPLSSN